MHIMYIFLFYSIWIAANPLVYPVYQMPYGSGLYGKWVLFCQENQRRSILLWDEASKVITRLTHARFNPIRVQASPDGRIVSFLDNGILWLRRISRRYTCPLETEYPIGAIIDYAWVDPEHLIICAHSGGCSQLYCIDINGNVYAKQHLVDHCLLSPCVTGTSLLCIARPCTRNSHSYVEQLLHIELEHKNDHPLFAETTMLWHTANKLGFCRSLSDDRAYCFIMKEYNNNDEEQVVAQLCLVDYATLVQPHVFLGPQIILDASYALHCNAQRPKPFAEGVLPLLPTLSSCKTRLYIPTVFRSRAAAEYCSQLYILELETLKSSLIAEASGISFLRPHESSSGLCFGGFIESCETDYQTGACSMFIQEDQLRLELGYIGNCCIDGLQ